MTDKIAQALRCCAKGLGHDDACENCCSMTNFGCTRIRLSRGCRCRKRQRKETSMSKAVLISIRPEWCEKIISGEKTIEVRKTRPKMDTPFKCYIYLQICGGRGFEMERLTFEGNFCDIAQCRDLACKQDGTCTQRLVWERLKAYEDAGLSPQACAQAAEIEKQLASYDFSAKKMLEFIKADKAGRCVVLPCKVGQRVFALMDTDKHISECEVKRIGMGSEIGFISLEPIGARGREYGVSLNGFGKTVFLTREEAEKALEERAGKKDG